MESVSVTGMAAGFVALAIMLSIGTLILGGSIADCTQVNGYNSSGSDGYGTNSGDTFYKFPQGTWAGQCHQNNSQAQAGYNLLIVALIVMAAAVIMIVVRHISG